MSALPETYFNQWRGIAVLWVGVLAGPLAATISQSVGYLFATLDCSYGIALALSPVMLLTLLLALGGAVLSWRNWRRLGWEERDDGGGVVSRSRFLAAAGLLLSSFSALQIVAMWLPIFFYRQCQR